MIYIYISIFGWDIFNIKYPFNKTCFEKEDENEKTWHIEKRQKITGCCGFTSHTNLIIPTSSARSSTTPRGVQSSDNRLLGVAN